MCSNKDTKAEQESKDLKGTVVRIRVRLCVEGRQVAGREQKGEERERAEQAVGDRVGFVSSKARKTRSSMEPEHGTWGAGRSKKKARHLSRQASSSFKPK